MRSIPVVFAFLCLAGCATAPKPRELESFEKLKAAALYDAAARRAPELVKEAQTLLDSAQIFWKSNDLYEARRDALAGQIKLRTALTLAEQDDAKRQVSAANAEYTKQYEEWTRVSKEHSATVEQLALLHKLGAARSQADADRMKADEEKRRLTDQLAQAQSQGSAQDRIRAAEIALKGAEAVEARTYAKMELTQAEDTLARAKLEIARGDLAAAGLSADLAKAKAEQATQLARPEYESKNSTTSNKARNESLQRDASAVPGVVVRIERRGDMQRLVLPLRDLFVKKRTTIAAGKEALLDALAQLANKYPTYAVQIVGHTERRGNSAQLIALSLARAQAVQGAMLSRGVDAKRMMTTGQGADEPVADNKTAQGRTANNRIEIIFSYQ